MKTILMVATIALAACTSSPVQTSELKPPALVVDKAMLVASPAKGRLVIKRDSGGPLGPRSCTQRISIDGKPVLELADQQGTTLYVEPGEHILRLTFATWLCDTGDSQLAVMIVAGEQKTVRSVINAASIATLQQSSN